MSASGQSGFPIAPADRRGALRLLSGYRSTTTGAKPGALGRLPSWTLPTLLVAFLAMSVGPIAAQSQKSADGAKPLMRYWIENGTLWIECLQPKCGKGSLVSMMPLQPRAVLELGAFAIDQKNLLENGAKSSGKTLNGVTFSPPTTQRAQGCVAQLLRARYARPGEDVAFVTRGYVYCSDRTISVSSSSSSRSHADRMFRFGYDLCARGPSSLRRLFLDPSQRGHLTP